MNQPSEKKDVLTITRIFNAPRQLVWQAWTNAEHMKHWWGPAGFTAPSIKMDLRVGGKYHFCMRSPEGKEYWTTGTYLQITEPEKLVFTDCFADPDGNVVPSTYYGMDPSMPELFKVTITLEDMGAQTKMILEHEGVPAGDLADQTSAGWNQSFDKLSSRLDS